MLLLLFAMYLSPLWGSCARGSGISTHLPPLWGFSRMVRSAHPTNVLFKRALTSGNNGARYGHLRNQTFMGSIMRKISKWL